MSRHIMVFNVGSSSLKFGLYAQDGQSLRAQASGVVEKIGAKRHFRVTGKPDETWDARDKPFHSDAMNRVRAWKHAAIPNVNLIGVGHRVVHGGAIYDRPIRVDDGVLEKLRNLIPLAPLHQPHNLAGIEAAQQIWPAVPQIACFDTAFHRGHAFAQDAFALPHAYYDTGIRRYGFHGLSYEYVAALLRERYPSDAAGRVVIAHLGNGASLCALRDGKSVATTMGFTALDGLPMGTRCGAIDPGVLLYLMQEKKMTPEALSDLLYNQSGLLGLSGLSSDMRLLLDSPTPKAADAIAVFIARIRHELGGFVALLGGLDTFVFCGGIGEHAAPIREAVLKGLDCFGIQTDVAANAAGKTIISSPASRVKIFVISTDEDAMIARQVSERVG